MNRFGLLHDLRYAVRMLLRRPIATLGVVLSLAFAIGVNASIVSLADQTLFKPLPVREPDRLVSVYGLDTTNGKYHGTSYRTYAEYRDRSSGSGGLMSGLAAFGRTPLEIADGARVISIQAEEVTGNYFDVLQARPVLGRLLTPDDDHAGSPPVVVIGARVWSARFQRDAHIVGRSITLGGRAFTIVGVLPEDFHGVLLDWNGTPDVWIPIEQLRTVLDTNVARQLLEDPQVDWMMVVGRLQPHATLAQAETAFRLIASQAPQPTTDRVAQRTIAVFSSNRTKFWPGARDAVEGRFTVLFAGAALLLLLACVNVTTLLVERGMERQSELALRLALGAGRWRIVRLLLTESALLAASSLAAAVIVASFTTQIIAKFPGGLGQRLELDTQVDVRTLVICGAVTLLVMLACALTPVVSSIRTEAKGALRTTTRIAGSSKRGTLARNALVAAQVGISMVVLMSATAFVETFIRAARVSTGFETDRLLFIQSDLSAKRYNPETAAKFVERVADRLKSTGVIAAATWTNSPPLTPVHYPVTLTRDAADTTAIPADSDSVAPSYFETLGIRLLAGRPFDTRDSKDTPKVAIVNQAMARELWGDARAAQTSETPIGKRFWLKRAANRGPEAYEVIGLAANSRYTSLWDDRPRVFFPLSQTSAYPTTLIVRTRGTSDAIATATRSAMTAEDPQLPEPQIRTWEETRDASLVQQRLGLTLFATVSGAMLLLTVVGLYGVMTSRVTQRRKEIAIRLALGASPETVKRSILTGAASIAAAGLLPGAALGVAATSFVASILPGLERSTSPTIAVIAASLITITTLATLAPARRAASTDPMRVLKDQ